MKLRTRQQRDTLQDRLIWQCASLLLCYPERERLSSAGELLSHIGGEPAALLGDTVTALSVADPMDAAAHYVDVFEMQRRTTMYLTYWTAGETRNRGEAMLAFSRAYREAGAEPPQGEAPDFLPVVLEFAATIDEHAGRQLLVDHSVPIAVLRDALSTARSPYAHAVTAVCHTLPAATDRDLARARQLAQVGPPAETVGLQPFTLTVPPRRAEGNR